MKTSAVASAIMLAAVAMMVAVCWSSSTPQRPKITGIATVRLEVSDSKAADNFYSQLNVLMGPCRVCGWRQSAALLPTGQDIISWKAEGTHHHVAGVGLQIDDHRAMMDYLNSKNIRFEEVLPTDAPAYLVVTDPEGHEVRFVETGKDYTWLSIKDEIRKSQPSPIRLIHAGWVVKDREMMDRFYRDVLGFHLYWQGGMKDDRVDWVSMQVPDGTDWIEYMLNVPENADKHLLGVMNHIALGVPSVREAAEQLKKNGVKLTEEPKIGRDGKWQLNLYDPDETRVELMEFAPVEKPCCSEFTGQHPRP